MKNKFMIVVLGALALGSAPIQAQWTATGVSVPSLVAFDNEMRNLMTMHGIPSGAIAVGWNGRLVLARGYSWNPGSSNIITQPTSLFRVASISKPITATLVNRLIQDGHLSPNDRINQYLNLTPRPGTTADPRLASVTVRNLLEMRGGFGDPATLGYDPVFRDATVAQSLGTPLPVTHADVIRYQSGMALSANPGERYLYSNYGYKLLGRIIEAASGMSYERYARRVLNPAGLWNLHLARARVQERLPGEVAYASNGRGPSVIDSTGAQLPWEYGALNQNTMDSYGGWVASAPELLRWMTNLDNPSAANAILNQASLTRMFAIPQNYPLPYTLGDHYYANGWSVRNYGATGITSWHAGSLPSTAAYVVRYRNGFNVAILLNRRNESNPDLTTNAMDTALWNAYGQVSTWPTHDLFNQVLPTLMRDGFD